MDQVQIDRVIDGFADLGIVCRFRRDIEFKPLQPGQTEALHMLTQWVVRVAGKLGEISGRRHCDVQLAAFVEHQLRLPVLYRL